MFDIEKDGCFIPYKNKIIDTNTMQSEFLIIPSYKTLSDICKEYPSEKVNSVNKRIGLLIDIYIYKKQPEVLEVLNGIKKDFCDFAFENALNKIQENQDLLNTLAIFYEDGYDAEFVLDESLYDSWKLMYDGYDFIDKNIPLTGDIYNLDSAIRYLLYEEMKKEDFNPDLYSIGKNVVIRKTNGCRDSDIIYDYVNNEKYDCVTKTTEPLEKDDKGEER